MVAGHLALTNPTDLITLGLDIGRDYFPNVTHGISKSVVFRDQNIPLMKHSVLMTFLFIASQAYILIYSSLVSWGKCSDFKYVETVGSSRQRVNSIKLSPITVYVNPYSGMSRAAVQEESN